MNPEIKKSAVRTGLILGGVYLFFTIIVWVLGAKAMSGSGMWMGMLLPIVAYFLVIRGQLAFKKSQGGFASFKESFGILVLPLIIGGLIGLVSQIAFLEMDSTYKEQTVEVAIDNSLKMMEKFGAPEAEIDKQIQAIPESVAPMGLFKQWLMARTTFNLVLCLVLAAFLKKNKPEILD